MVFRKLVELVLPRLWCSVFIVMMTPVGVESSRNVLSKGTKEFGRRVVVVFLVKTVLLVFGGLVAMP